MSTSRRFTQVLVIGSGIAGCTTALTLADAGHDVTLINAGQNLEGGNSELAQGGIVYKAATGNDAPALEKDIRTAGHDYNYAKAIQYLCEHGPRQVEEVLMQKAGVLFDKSPDGSLNLTREGGHATPRILHTADYTGRAIMEGLTRSVSKHPRITVLTHRTAIDLLTSHHHARCSQYRYDISNRCLGAYICSGTSKQTETILAEWTVLATGGVGQVFLHSTNAPSCVGSGISMAFRAGATLANLEFMQFHPTALYQELSHRRPLITEAMRGEGARLLDTHGDPFMLRYDPRGDLAPRDIVAQAMIDLMLRTGAPCLFLDASRMEHDLPKRFPTVWRNCQEVGIDICSDPIPVVPAAHYSCGGILTDTHGRTTLHGLYAVGECACTGLHGANRLASTSLLEGLVWGASCGSDIAARLQEPSSIPKTLYDAIEDWEHLGDEHNDDTALLAQDWVNIRHTMWNYVGITRSTARLRRAFEDMRNLVRHIHDFYKRTRISPRLVDLFHGSQTAYLITQAALRNRESLGCHHRID